MKNIMDYKGYYGSVNFDPDEPIFYGKLEFIRALVSYEAEDAVGIQQAFHEAVDDYLVMCKSENIEPEKPCKGSFNVRIGEVLHTQAAILAVQQEISMNEFIKRAILHAIESYQKSGRSSS